MVWGKLTYLALIAWFFSGCAFQGEKPLETANHLEFQHCVAERFSGDSKEIAKCSHMVRKSFLQSLASNSKDISWTVEKTLEFYALHFPQNPSRAQILLRAGIYYNQVGNAFRADSLWNTVLTQFPNQPFCQSEAAWLISTLSKNQSDLALQLKLINFQLENRSFLPLDRIKFLQLHRADILFQLGEHQQSALAYIEVLKTPLKEMETRKIIWNNLVQVFAQIPQGVDLAEEFLEENFEDKEISELMMQVGEWHLKKKNFREAEYSFWRFLQLEPYCEKASLAENYLNHLAQLGVDYY